MNRRLAIACGFALSGVLGVSAPLVQGQAADGVARVLVLPFASESAVGAEWMGSAVQQDLSADLTQGTTARIVASSTAAPATDEADALRAARESGASVVVFGQTQASGKEVRLTGEVVDVATARPLGAIKATGPADELFHLEDALAGQVLGALPRVMLTEQTLSQRQQQSAPVTPLSRAPQQQTPEASPATPVNPLSRGESPAPVLASGDAAPPVQAPGAEPPPAPVVQQADSPYVSVTEAPYPAPAPVPPPDVIDDSSPVVIESGPSYPAYGYDYSDAPIYDDSCLPDAAPAYGYASPGCSVWPEFNSGIYIGGGYGRYGEYGHYRRDGFHGEWGRHDEGGIARHYEGGARFTGPAIGGRSYIGSQHGFGDVGGRTYSGVHGDARPGGAFRPSYLSTGSAHVMEGMHQAGVGASRGFTAPSRGFYPGGSGSRFGTAGSSHAFGGRVGGSFHGAGHVSGGGHH